MQYDVIIIGSGIGGLGTAYFLGKYGLKVLVLEKNRQYGGALQIFSRDKQILDVGVHYVGSLGPKESLGRYFRAWGIYDSLQFEALSQEGYDRILFSNEEPILFAQGFENHAESLMQRFPHDKEGIEKYVEHLKNIPADFPFYNFHYGKVDPLSNPYLGQNANSYIHKLVKDPLLRKALFGAGILYDYRASSTSLYTHSIIQSSYVQSAWKFKRGGAQIVKYLVQNCKNLGVEFRNYAQVVKIITNSEGVCGVELQEGEQIKSRQVVSNIHPALTYKLLDDTGRVRKSYIDRISNLENSLSCFSAQFVMKRESFPYQNFNSYIHHGNDEYLRSRSVQQLGIFPSLDETDQRFANIINVMTYMDFSEVQEWAHTFRTEPHYTEGRGKGYEEFKKRKEEEIIKIIDQYYPNFSTSIEAIYSSTALTLRDYLNTPNGSMYGVIHDSNYPASTVFSPKTKVPGLYLVGQSLNLHGILGTSISAAVTSDALIGGDYMKGLMDFE